MNHPILRPPYLPRPPIYYFPKYRKMNGMGASYTPEMVKILDDQLLQYKNQLSDLYDRKNIEIAKREAARFHYLGAWRSRFQAILNLISTDIFNLNQPEVSLMWNAFQGAIQRSVPMENLSGMIPKNEKNQPIFAIEPARENCVPGPKGFCLGLLSPMQDWLSEAGELKGIERLQGNIRFLTPSLYASSFGEVMTSTGFVDMPWNWETIKDAFISGSYLSDEQKNEAAFKVANFFTKSYPGLGTIFDIMNEGKSLLVSLVENTMKLIETQRQILDLENQIKEFLEQYRAYGGISSEAGQTYKEIADLAQKSQVASMKADISTPPVGSTVVQKEETFPEGSLLKTEANAAELYPSTSSADFGGEKKKVNWALVGGAAVLAMITMG